MAQVTFKAHIPEKKCPKCGKRFIVAPMHIYRDKGKYYCSWTCYLHRKDTGVKANDKGTT